MQETKNIDHHYFIVVDCLDKALRFGDCFDERSNTMKYRIKSVKTIFMPEFSNLLLI